MVLISHKTCAGEKSYLTVYQINPFNLEINSYHRNEKKHIPDLMKKLEKKKLRANSNFFFVAYNSLFSVCLSLNVLAKNSEKNFVLIIKKSNFIIHKTKFDKKIFLFNYYFEIKFTSREKIERKSKNNILAREANFSCLNSLDTLFAGSFH
ncbi:hypothetical protein BpHYR1_002705 [Brachionus plicatilis]|uniref:Uncharacterized protein n=1 Tax=Brachionus plicatilis TaxID=10195 RepID=A0A3M7QHX7_BRAPC|nr:hypothetical protein BpHYR1_002705 [Brachionus plicatilis]